MGSLEEVRVLVTGATGFIGSHLVRRLAHEGAEINIISRNESSMNNLLSKYVGGDLILHKADLENFSSINRCVKSINPEKVFHLGGFVNLKRDFNTANICVRTNIQGTLNMLNALEDMDCSFFVHIGTYDVYGFNPVPFREDQPLDPLSPYSISKATSEYFCRFANKIYDIPVVLLRLSNVYGPNQGLERLIPYVIRCCIEGSDIRLTEGEQTKDFLYVDDAVEGIIRSSLYKKAISETINVGSGEEHSIKDIVEKIIDLTGSSIVPQYGEVGNRAYEPERLCCDITKAEKVLGWRPRYSLENGLKETIDRYLCVI